jgi:hypothetical protein
VRSLHPSDCEGLEPRLGLEGFPNKDWKKSHNRVLSRILRSPAITLGVGEHRFTEDWGIFRVDRAKLSVGFQGNKMDLGAF